MTTEILALENKFDELLPKEKQQQRTTSALMDAGKKWSTSIWLKANEIGSFEVSNEEIVAAIKFSEPAIFICGSERSGTTLLRNLLDSHTQLCVLPSEGTYYTNTEQKLLRLPISERCEFLCKEWLWRLVLSMHQPPYWLLGRSTENESPYINFARAFITWWNILEAKKDRPIDWPFIVLQLAFASTQNDTPNIIKQLYWVEKTPNNEHYISRILQAFPKAKIIQTIRNPTDVLRSNKPSELLSTVSKFDFIHNLKKSFKIAHEQLIKKDTNHLIIRYEDLCLNPTITMQQVAAFIGIEYEEILLTPTVVGKLTGANSSFKQPSAEGKIISAKERVQVDQLTAKDHQLLATYLGDLAKPFNYNLLKIGILRKQFFKAKTFASKAFRKIKRTIFSNS